MSEFSKFCKVLREKSGMTIYQIAKVSGMERTALNRMILGKRFPKQEDMELFCEVIRANEREKEKLRELYMREKMGKRRYENCQYIRKLLEELDYEEGVGDRMYWMSDGMMSEHPDCSQSFVQGKEKVEGVIYYVLERAYSQKKLSTLYTNFPVKEKMLSPAVHFFSEKYKKDIPLFHFLILNVNPEEYYDADCNLKVLYHTLAWKFREGANYMPYYTYSQIMISDLALQLVPYYLVSDNCVLFVSSDFCQGIFLDDAELAAFYQRKMKNLCDRLVPLFQSEDRIENKYFPNNTEFFLKHLDIQVDEKAVRIEKNRKSLSVVIKESSLCEAFHDFSSYISEIKNIAHRSAHIEERTVEDI